MKKIFTCWRSTKIGIGSLSLAVLACLPALGGAIASPLSPSPKQQSNLTKIVSAPRPPTKPIDSKYRKNPAGSAANPSPAATTNARGTAAGRSLEIKEIRGSVSFKGRPAVAGDRLQAPGDEIITGANSTARIAIDNNTGIVEVAEKTAVRISNLSGSEGGEKDTAIFVSRGRVRLSIGKTAAATPAANTSTIIPPNQIAALNSFSGLGNLSQIAQQKKSARTAPVRVETPEGVAGVRGTSFGVSVSEGKTSVETIEGAVAVSGSTDSEVVVNGGSATTIFSQSPPAPISASPRLAELKVRSLFRLSGNIYRLSGQINPIDIIYVNNEAVKIDRDGKFKIQGILPPSRRLNIVVRAPSVRERHYSLAVP
ncbi:FecR domain-containing protein [Tychonema sp. LEGE 07203]|uniref:FecR family protein n=1 Tax=Tychonema sp. LEGE 07203 TaxID=1828671 RepID=UPI001882EDB6|nr:FecR family protein [Tychonema sp. LEGE 07203]MBE9096255.1 FecR domain-containing protein [Tychonema sp. LEGE 07203]